MTPCRRDASGGGFADADAKSRPKFVINGMSGKIRPLGCELAGVNVVVSRKKTGMHPNIEAASVLDPEWSL